MPLLTTGAGAYPAVGGGGGSAAGTITDSSAQHGAFGSIASFSMAVGSYAPATDDLVLFTYDEQASATTGAMTIGGVSATKIEANATDSKTVLWSIPRGSGVSISGGNVTVAPVSGSYGVFCAIIGFVHGAASGTPTAHQTTAYSFFSDPNEITSCTVSASGVGFGFWGSQSLVSDLPITTWYGITRTAGSEKFIATGNGVECSGGVQATAGTYTVGLRHTGGPGPSAGCFGFVAFA